MNRWLVVAIASALFFVGDALLGVPMSDLKGFVGECLIYAGGIVIGCLIEKEKR